MLINTFEKLLAMLLLQVASLPTYKAQLGLSDAFIEEVEQDAANLQAVNEYWLVTEAKKKSVNKIKQELYNGDKNVPISPFPEFKPFTPPFPLVAGALERANRRNRQIKAADGYTKEIGIAFGIEGDAPSVSPDSVKPTVEGFPAQTGYEAALVIGNRGKADFCRVLGRRMNSEKRAEIGSGTGKSINVKITPTAEGQPERMEVTIQLYKSNEPYGQPSDSIYITFNP
jgi:hypothetical protein